MKPIKVYISNDTAVDSAVEHLENHVPEASQNSPEYGFIFPEIKSCIEEFSSKAKKLAKTGTTIRIEKEFTLPGVNVYIILECPKKIGFLEKITGMLKRE
jgi:hypothetical protein